MIPESSQTSNADSPGTTEKNDALAPESNEAANESVGPSCANAPDTVELPNKVTRKKRSKLFRRRPYQSSEEQEGKFFLNMHMQYDFFLIN